MGPGADALRTELRGLVKEHVPHDYLGAFTDDPADLEIAQRFCGLLADRGQLCLAWPAEFGGRGASVWEQTVVREEMWAHHEPRGAQHLGVNWVGPAIMRHGTPDQRRAHLPAIARGEVIWCQGFSEADADAGPAALRTVARPVTDPVADPVTDPVADPLADPLADPVTGAAGSGWRIDGQQIWTANALLAQWCFLLARTSAGEQAQQGLTVFLVPMSAHGIEVRPVATMLGPHRLNEVCFDGRSEER